MNRRSRCRFLAVAVTLLLALRLDICHAFAAKKARRSTGAGGFGAPTTTKQYTPDTSATTLKLMEFLKLQKAETAKVEIGTSHATGMRGLFAAKAIGAEKIICKVPSDIALALSDPNEDQSLSIVQEGANFLKFYWNDETKRSIWSPYLDTLPSVVDKTPDYFEPEEIELLEFPRLVQSATKRRDEINQLSSLDASMDRDELQYATWLVSSRSFPIIVADENDEHADQIMFDERGQVMTATGERRSIRVMVPLLDMANYHWQPNARLELLDPEKDDAWFALQATRPIPAGKEITLAYSYGSSVPSTVELLSNYGLVPTENKVDTFMLNKGGDDALDKDGWTTSLEEDYTMLKMLSEDDVNLRKVLQFRIRMKEAYDDDDK